MLNIYRYSPDAIEEALKQVVNAWKSKQKQSILEQLQEVVERLPPHDVLRLRDAINDLEKKNSFVLCTQLSRCLYQRNQSIHSLNQFPFRIIIRQIGIFALKEISNDNALVELESQINSELAQAFKLGQEISSQAFKHDDISLFNLNWHNLSTRDLLVRVVASIKLLISRNLHNISESIQVDPSELANYFQLAFSECYEHENLHQNILQVLNEETVVAELQQMIEQIQKDILVFLNEDMANSHEAELMQTSDLVKISDDLVSVIEKNFMADLTSINSLIVDLWMV